MEVNLARVGRAGWQRARRQETAEVAGFCHGLDIRFWGQVMIRHRLPWKMDGGTTSFQMPQLLSSGTHADPPRLLEGCGQCLCRP